MLSKLSEKNIDNILIPEMYKNKEDRNFALELLQKVILNDDELTIISCQRFSHFPQIITATLEK